MPKQGGVVEGHGTRERAYDVEAGSRRGLKKRRIPHPSGPCPQ